MLFHNPELSIIIPAFNEEALLPSTLQSLHQAFMPAGIRYEIIVCDNNSTDRTASAARAHGAAVVFEPHNQIARARNTGARAACGEWLLFMDADTCITQRLAACFLKTIRSAVVGAGGAPVHFDSHSLDLAPRCFLAMWNFISRTARLAAGSFIYCRRAAWEETGGFDEAFYAGEEIFFSLKLKQWCRRQRMKFRILPAPVFTSARKLHWYSPAQLWFAVFKTTLPGALKDRKRCAYWYERPAADKSISP